MPDISISDLPLDERSRTGILSADALAFLVELHGRFDARRLELLAARAERRAAIAAGGRLDFLPETREIREDSSWKAAAPRSDYADRRVEIIGPTDRKLVIDALNSGAKGFMADFEDANSPTWANQVSGHVNLVDAIEGTITYKASDGRHYELVDDPATLMVRLRGWHLPERHFSFDGAIGSGALVDFGLFAFHGAPRLAAKGRGAYLYLPKMEHHLEARLWDEVLTFAEDSLGLDRGTVPRHRPDRDVACRLPDGGDPLRAARALLRDERGPLGLHLLGDQDLPRAPRCRPSGPRRR